MTDNGNHPEDRGPLPPVLPAPTPTAFSFDIASTPTKRYVIFTVHTPSGVAVYFMEPEIAFGVAKQMRSAAQACMNQPIIETPNQGLIVPE